MIPYYRLHFSYGGYLKCNPMVCVDICLRAGPRSVLGRSINPFSGDVEALPLGDMITKNGLGKSEPLRLPILTLAHIATHRWAAFMEWTQYFFGN